MTILSHIPLLSLGLALYGKEETLLGDYVIMGVMLLDDTAVVLMTDQRYVWSSYYHYYCIILHLPCMLSLSLTHSPLTRIEY